VIQQVFKFNYNVMSTVWLQVLFLNVQYLKLHTIDIIKMTEYTTLSKPAKISAFKY